MLDKPAGSKWPPQASWRDFNSPPPLISASCENGIVWLRDEETDGMRRRRPACCEYHAEMLCYCSASRITSAAGSRDAAGTHTATRRSGREREAPQARRRRGVCGDDKLLPTWRRARIGD